MMDYLGRGMDATAYTLPSFMRFDARMLNAVAILIGQGEEWPTDGTAHLGRDAWELAKERLRIPKSLPPTGARRRMELEYQDWARLQGRGPRTGGPFDRTIGWRSWWSPGTGKTLQRTRFSLMGSRC